MQPIIDQLTSYYATQGSFADAAYFANLVVTHSWKEIRVIFNVVLGSV